MAARSAGGRRRGPAGSGRDGGAQSAEEALGRAARHARVALAEAVLAARALADAAALAATGRPLASDGVLGGIARSLEDVAEGLAAGIDGPAASLLTAVSEALESEIARWEERAREDADARAVLRAYLGLREILWELGVRGARGGEARGARPGAGSRGGGRVQRVPVDGGP
jgi:hypothetical protein